MSTREVPLYGQAEAIRVLYQTGVRDESPPKPPRSGKRRGLWITRYVDSLGASLRAPAGAKF